MEFGRLRTLIDVGELGSLLPSPRHGLRTIVERYASDPQIALDVAVEADSYATLKDLVRNGHRVDHPAYCRDPRKRGRQCADRCAVGRSCACPSARALVPSGPSDHSSCAFRGKGDRRHRRRQGRTGRVVRNSSIERPASNRNPRYLYNR